MRLGGVPFAAYRDPIQGQTDEAIACYRDALEVNPEYALAHHNLGYYLMSRNRPDEAITHYRSARKINPKVVDPAVFRYYELRGR